MVLRLVAENAKQRFELFYGYDPSPPPPKKGKKGQGGGGKKGQSGKNAKAQSSAPAPVPIDVVDQPGQAVDAAQVEDLAHEVAKSTLTEDSPSLATPTEPMEMPLVSLPVPEGDDADNEAGREGEYFIRATQGHSLNLDSVAHLEEVRDDEEGRAKTGEMVHGTKWEIWETLSTSTTDTASSPVPPPIRPSPFHLDRCETVPAPNTNV
jgi:2'-phosphotransferase